MALPATVSAAGSDNIRNDETGIPDKGLYRAILRKLGKSKNGKFTKAEAESITKLNANNYDNKYINIKTLKGIENLTKLRELYVCGNELTSLAGIENLTGLTLLDAGSNKLKDLKAIKNLIKLETLYVGGNKLTSLTGVENLTELSCLLAWNNKLRNLPDLKKLKNLEAEETYFEFNSIKTAEEFKRNLPISLVKSSSWLKSQIKFQNLTETMKLITPKSLKKITKNTVKIVGKTQKGAKVILRTSTGKKIKAVKANAKGIFTLNKLNLKKYGGKKLTLEAFLYHNYHDENWTLDSVKFTVRKK